MVDLELQRRKSWILDLSCQIVHDDDFNSLEIHENEFVISALMCPHAINVRWGTHDQCSLMLMPATIDRARCATRAISAR
jgi:hypothetical protein